MIVYAESSAILAWLFAEPCGGAVASTLRASEYVVISDLLLVECDRALIRATTLGALEGAAATSVRKRLAAAAGHWQVLRISPTVLERSRQPFPAEPIRSLDALHLASALSARSYLPELVVLSLDKRIRDNATELGFVVYP